MLWHANELSEDSNRTRAADDVWGAELVDQSLATAWYPAEWASVTDDELVFLLPSLCNWPTGRHAEPARRGPIDYLTRTLTARADAASRLIARRSGLTDPAAAAEIHDRLVASGLLSSIDAHRRSTTLRDSRAPAPGRDQGRLPDWLIAELVALAYTNRMLSDALGSAAPQGVDAPLIDWPLTLADVVVASISARLNGAYVYPEHGYAHELLALAALLGHLVEGRTAYLPPSIAGTLLDILRAKPSADDQTAAVLRAYIEWAGGANRLMLWARIINATGVARRIAPRAALVPRALRAAWNPRLLQRLDAQSL
ncbi:hypothetical protein GIW81_06930 [Hyphomicrobium sp. xq]|uniref:Uncharacterized protein n=1 Tax=Hyphomicrobium album TaxID=2665159 RepID=A0A6I3KJG5_9HYPH|nr:hypothetical protein [Hyphomicrobium album]MTD94070.1 hypothetical protein [Hyphomicrobium album]